MTARQETTRTSGMAWCSAVLILVFVASFLGGNGAVVAESLETTISLVGNETEVSPRLRGLTTSRGTGLTTSRVSAVSATAAVTDDVEPSLELVLVDAQRGVDLFTITNGMVVDADAIQTPLVNFRADANTVLIESVLFDYNDGTILRRDNQGQFTLVPKYMEWTHYGEHFLLIQAYSEDQARGELLFETTIHFTVVSASQGVQHVPRFTGPWGERDAVSSTHLVGRSAGGFLGRDFVVVAGFVPGLRVLPTVSALAVDDDTETWQSLQDYPLEGSVTHAAHAVDPNDDNKLYLCGGYVGRHPGQETDACFVFDKSANTWTSLPSLPAARGGGGMVFVSRMNALVFSLGANRNAAGHTVDHADTYLLELNRLDRGWQVRASVPTDLATNHVSAVTATDCRGREHYFFVGGQSGENEQEGNSACNWEYMPETDRWIKRLSMPQPRGHTASSVIPYSCGFVMVGGSVNSGDPDVRLKTNDISYYDVNSNKWARIGTYKKKANTPICDIARDLEGVDYLYCGLGYEKTMYRRPIHVTLPPPTPAPTSAPTIDPENLDRDIRSLTLFNADTNEQIGLLRDGMVLDISELGTNLFTIRAAVGLDVSSVRFDLDNGTYERIDSFRPFTLASFVLGIYNGLELEPGSHTVTATPYTRNFGLGIAGESLTMSFFVQ